MLLAVYNHYQQDLDLLIRFLDNQMNRNGLMCWQEVLPSGSTNVIPTPEPPGAGLTSATDGDLDIAHALVLASEKWTHQPDERGMAVPARYMDRARRIMNSIWNHTVDANKLFFYLGDWVTPEDAKYSRVTRVSDFNLLAIYTFMRHDTAHNWKGLLDNLINILVQLFESNRKTGFFPDFATLDKDGKWRPVTGQILETEYDGCYSYNACRVPWRIAAYYKATRDHRVEPILRWYAKFAGYGHEGRQGPKKIVSGYTLDGQPLNDYQSAAFLMPMWTCLHVLNDPTAERFYLEAMACNEDSGYFEDAIMNLCVSQCF